MEDLLRQRAEQYAAPQADDRPTQGEMVLAFQLGEERYAVDVMVVRGLRAVRHITPVPAVPRFYRGVVNIRGQIITVLDLRVFFEMPADDLPAELVVVEAKGLRLGLLAHRIEDVLPVAEYSPVDDLRYARGLTADGLILLDIPRLLEDERLIVGGRSDE